MKNLRVYYADYDSSLRITKANRVYSYFRAEYINGSDLNEDYYIPVDTKKNNLTNLKRKLLNLRDKYSSSLDRRVSVGTGLYTYFASEYRENKLVVDQTGNIILTDDIIKRKIK